MKQPQTTAAYPRLIIAVDKFYPQLDGPGLQAQETAKRLRAKGMETMIVTRQRHPEHARFERVDGTPVYRILPRGSRSSFVSVLTIPTLLVFLLRHRHTYDLIQFYDMRSYIVVALLVHWLTGKPFILKSPAQGAIKRHLPGTAKLSFFSTLLRRVVLPDRVWFWMLGHAEAIIALSTDIIQEMADCGLGHLAVHIPGGVDVERFKPATPQEKQALRQQLTLPPHGPIIISHGRLGHSKRLDILLHACFKLRQDYPDLVVLLPGNTSTGLPAVTQLQSIIKAEGAEHAVIMTGPVHHIEKYLRAADIYALTSEYEGLPNAVIEAMACGLPIVATAIGGVSDLIQNGLQGLLVPVGDIDATTAALRRIIEAPAFAQQLGQQANAHVQQHYAWPTLIDRYLAFYASVT